MHETMKLAAYDENKFQPIQQKGAFTYDYLTSVKVLLSQERVNFPAEKIFHNKLYDQDIGKEEYERAEEVWNKFDCKTIRKYHDIYLMSDVTLLADAFEDYRVKMFQQYELDPSH